MNSPTTTRHRSGSKTVLFAVVATTIAVADLYRRFGPRPHLARRSAELTREVLDPWVDAILHGLLPPQRADQMAADTALLGVYVGDQLWRRRHHK